MLLTLEIPHERGRNDNANVAVELHQASLSIANVLVQVAIGIVRDGRVRPLTTLELAV